MATRTEHEMERNVARMDSSPVAPLATFPTAPLFVRGGGGRGGGVQERGESFEGQRCGFNSKHFLMH